MAVLAQGIQRADHIAIPMYTLTFSGAPVWQDVIDLSTNQHELIYTESYLTQGSGERHMIHVASYYTTSQIISNLGNTAQSIEFQVNASSVLQARNTVSVATSLIAHIRVMY